MSGISFSFGKKPQKEKKNESSESQQKPIFNLWQESDDEEEEQGKTNCKPNALKPIAPPLQQPVQHPNSQQPYGYQPQYPQGQYGAPPSYGAQQPLNQFPPHRPPPPPPVNTQQPYAMHSNHQPYPNHQNLPSYPQYPQYQHHQQAPDQSTPPKAPPPPRPPPPRPPSNPPPPVLPPARPQQISRKRSRWHQTPDQPPPPAAASTDPMRSAPYSTQTPENLPKAAEHTPSHAAVDVGVTDSVSAANKFMELAKLREEQRSKKQAEEESSHAMGKTSFEKRRTYAVFKEDGSRGHHMQDYIPKEELDQFMSKCKQKDQGDGAVEEKKPQIQIAADNIGHKLLSKMGWAEGQGIGSSKQGILEPVKASGSMLKNAGLGTEDESAVKEDDDIFAQYKKRMMLGYKHRPNPLGNPRKQYY